MSDSVVRVGIIILVKAYSYSKDYVHACEQYLGIEPEVNLFQSRENSSLESHGQKGSDEEVIIISTRYRYCKIRYLPGNE